MSRYIDADEITKEKLIEFVGCQDSISFDDLLWMIKDYIPTADVVEVVRCKDCENFDTTNCSVGCGWCDVWDIGRFEDGYCDKGKKVE